MLKHTKIFLRLAMLLVINVALMVALGGIGYFGMSSIREGLRTVYEDRTVTLGQLRTMQENYYEIRLAVLAGLGANDPSVLTQKKADAEQRKAETDAVWSAYLSTSMTDEENQLIAAAKTSLQAYDAVWPEVFAKTAAGDQEGAKALAAGQGGPAFAALSKDIAALADLQTRVADEEYQKAKTTFFRNVAMLIGIVAGAVLVGGVLAWVIARSITLPLGQIIGVMSELTKGNLKVEVAGQDRGDEVGSVSKAVGVFKDGLVEADRLRTQQQIEQERQIERGKKMEVAVTAFDKMISEIVGAVTSAATELQATAQSLSATAEEASQQSNAVAAASEQMTQNVQTVASATEELSSSIREIGNQVTESSRIVGTAVTQAEDTNAKVKALAEAAQRIGDVVTLINEIAGQTNLLALNATIEAARAGEAGKGFAVVASEVKNLATQTAKATDEISGQVRSIQDATSTSVQAIDGIAQTIHRVNEISTAIASAVEEQGAATQEIARNVQEASTGTAEVSSNIVGVTQASQQTSAGATQVLSAASELARNGEKLKQEVETFLATVRAA
jgi:methyl-accepting chemotaxis protein